MQRQSLRLLPVKNWLFSRQKSGGILAVSFPVPDPSFPPLPSAKLRSPLTGQMWFIFENFFFFFIGAATRVGSSLASKPDLSAVPSC